MKINTTNKEKIENNQKKGQEMKIIEKREVNGIYGLKSNQAIINHPKHGTLLVVDSFGGMDSSCGGAYRFRHGKVIALVDGDTFETLENSKWNEDTSLFEAVISGYDETRKPQMWTGLIIEKLAIKIFKEKK